MFSYDLKQWDGVKTLSKTFALEHLPWIKIWNYNKDWYLIFVEKTKLIKQTKKEMFPMEEFAKKKRRKVNKIKLELIIVKKGTRD